MTIFAILYLIALVLSVFVLTGHVPAGVPLLLIAIGLVMQHVPLGR